MIVSSSSVVRNVLLSAVVITFAACAAHAEVELETTFDSSVEFFSAFNDYAVGTHIYDSTSPSGWSEKGPFANKVKNAYYAKVGCKGTGGLYVTDDAPGKYIYSSLSAMRPMAANPCGIRHDYNGNANAIYLYLNGMAKPLGTATGHTVEMFFKVDRSYSGAPIMTFYDPYPGDNKNRVIAFLQSGSNINKLQIKNLGSEAPVPGDNQLLTYGGLANFNDGHWHHLAIVYKAEWEGVKLYCDYTLVSGIVKVNVGENANQMRIGDNSNGFPGLTSAVRVSTAALEPKDFMRASNHANGPDPDVEFFSAFDDYEVGTHIYDDTMPSGWTEKGIFANKAKNAYHARVQCKGTGGLYVTDDAPGKYIYSSLAATHPMAVNPRGIRHDGNGTDGATFFCMYSMAQPLALAAEHTVELFFKVDRSYSDTPILFFYDPYPGDNKQRAIVWLQKDMKTIRVQNLGSEAPSEPKYQDYAYDSSYVNDGNWHHVAVVYKAEWQGIKLYCDYALVSDVIKVNVAENTNQLRIGNNGNSFPGLTSAIRVTGVALEPEGFMRASNSSCGPEQNTDNYLFPFNEETVGTIYRNDDPTATTSSETRFKGYNARGNLAVRSYVKGAGTGEICADSPGNYLYGDVYSKVPLAAGVKSYRQHNPDLSSNADQSFLQLVGASHRMARYGSHTLEFFWKSETFPYSLDMAYWDLVKETAENGRRYALLMGTSSTADYIKLWTVLLKGEDIPAASPVEISYEGYKTTSVAQSGLADGMWHHTAVVFDATTGSAQLYCDYALTSEAKVPIGDLTGLELPKTDCEMRYGSYKWDSYLSAVRISKGKLTPDRFLYASDSPDCALPKAGVTWRLDGTAGATVADTNVTVTAKQYVHTIAAGARGDAVATGEAVYSGDVLPGSRYVGNVRRGPRNQSSAALAPGASLRSSGLGPLVSSASAFTVQALVKANAHPSAGEALLLAQADQTRGYAWALVERADGSLAFRAKLINPDGSAGDLEVVSSGVLPLGGWHAVAASCDKETGAVKLYLDYQEVASIASTDGRILCGDGALVSGAVGSFAAVDGLVDEIAFCREILSAADLTQIKQYGLTLILR